MAGAKDALKRVIGRVAELARPDLGREIDEARNPTRAPRLKRAILSARLARAQARGDTAAIENALAAFWKGGAGDRFHDHYAEERFKLFREQHAQGADGEIRRCAWVEAAGFQRPVEMYELGLERAGVCAVLEPRPKRSGFLLYFNGLRRPEFSLNQRVGETCEESEIDEGGCEGSRPPALRGILEPRQPKVENIGKLMGIVPGDAVVALRHPHGFQKRDGRLAANTMARHLAEPAGVCLPDGCISVSRILDAQSGETLGEPRAEIAGSFAHGS